MDGGCRFTNLYLFLAQKTQHSRTSSCCPSSLEGRCARGDFGRLPKSCRAVLVPSDIRVVTAFGREQASDGRWVCLNPDTHASPPELFASRGVGDSKRPKKPLRLPRYQQKSLPTSRHSLAQDSKRRHHEVISLMCTGFRPCFGCTSADTPAVFDFEGVLSGPNSIPVYGPRV